MQHLIRTRFLFIIFISSIFFSCAKEESRAPEIPDPIAGNLNLTVTGITDSSATVNWTNDSVSTYTLFLSLDSNFNNNLPGYNPATVTATTHVVTGLQAATHYFVKLVAQNGSASNDARTSFTTPDADSIIVLTSIYTGKLYAFSGRNGTELWSYQASAAIYSNPMIYDSLVYFGAENGSLYCINLRTGIRLWKSDPVPSGAGIQSSVVIKDNVIYVGDYRGYVHAFDKQTGNINWSYLTSTLFQPINSSAIIDGNILYVSTYEGYVYAIDIITQTEIWKSINTNNPITSGLAVSGNKVYVGCLPHLYAFDKFTGDTAWTSRIIGIEAFDGSPTVDDSTVYIGNQNGNIWALNVTDGALRWSTNIIPFPIYSSPVKIGNSLYIVANNKAFALNASNGTVNWINEDLTSPNDYCGPTVTPTAIYTATYDGQVAAIDPITGVTKWIVTSAGARFQSSACVVSRSGIIYYPGESGEMQ